MDDLLLGLLDGVVRGISVLYRIHLPRKNGAADDPRRICLLRQRHLPELHYFRKLQPRTPGGKLDVMAIYAAGNDLYTTIISIIQTLPLAPLVLVLLIVAMVAFYATSFDSIALVASSYTYRQITGDEEPHNAVKAFWAIMLILLPMALVFSDSSMANLQSVSIIAAFPVAFVILLIIASFLKDASDYLKS
jgi:glucan phosphoethanolaminetransferase (alkaline phosphatase superfamily)